MPSVIWRITLTTGGSQFVTFGYVAKLWVLRLVWWRTLVPKERLTNTQCLLKVLSTCEEAGNRACESLVSGPPGHSLDSERANGGGGKEHPSSYDTAMRGKSCEAARDRKGMLLECLCPQCG
jgi:hypothetical protein